MSQKKIDIAGAVEEMGAQPIQNQPPLGPQAPFFKPRPATIKGQSYPPGLAADPSTASPIPTFQVQIGCRETLAWKENNSNMGLIRHIRHILKTGNGIIILNSIRPVSLGN